MFDYLSAIYYGESFPLRPDSPLEHPGESTDRALLRRLDQVKFAMGQEFYDKLYRDLFVLLEHRQAETFHAGAHTGAHLMLALLDHER